VDFDDWVDFCIKIPLGSRRKTGLGAGWNWRRPSVALANKIWVHSPPVNSHDTYIPVSTYG